MSSESSTTIDPLPAEAADDDEPRFRVAGELIVPAPQGSARYRRGEELARGGRGRVASALDRTLQREVAIKELHERTEQDVRRFVREGLTTARLQHPSIVPILDAGMWESGDPFLVMKLLEGKTLAEELAARATAAERIALLPNLLAVADALGYAHAQGVVHRDVKPANIMIGGHGETVLLDWGVAYDRAASELEIEGAVAGTVRYMSPEQARGEPAACHFDVYSLGLTIATVLGGRVPFEGESQQEMLEALRGGRAIAPALPRETPVDLVAIIAKATATPAERYAHAGRLADDLRKYIAGQLVGARRYTRRQLVVRWLRRNRVFVAGSVVVLAAVAIAAVIAVRSGVRERDRALAAAAAAEVRARELVLLQARASLRADPTAAIAWLKQYPETAPDQDVVLAMVDEAAGRGVARHVWRGASVPVDAAFTADERALAIAMRDGTLVRADLATGARRAIGRLGATPLFVRATPDAVVALDVDGGIHRAIGDGPLERRQTMTLAARPHELYFVAGANELKTVFPDEEAQFVPLGTLAPPRSPSLPREVADSVFDCDENNTAIVYAVDNDGGLFVFDGGVRKLGALGRDAWIHSSPGGAAYVAVVPGGQARAMGDRVAIWAGLASGEPPRQLGELPACAPRDDLRIRAGITDDARVAVVERCGALTAFGHGAPREIADASRVGAFSLSADGRRLLLQRTDALEIVALDAGAIHRFTDAAAITSAGFAPSQSWVQSIDEDQGVRVWPLADRARLGKLGDGVTPARITLVDDRGRITIQRRLECAHWRTADRAIERSFGIAAQDAADLDQDPLLWPLAISDDGETCLFAGRNETLIAVSASGERRVLRAATELVACALAGERATCRSSRGELVAFDLRTGARAAGRTLADGALRGLASYRGATVALVAHAAGCTLEDPGGRVIATLPGRPDCRRLRASNAHHAGRESALLVERSSTVDVWSDAGLLTVPTENALVEVSPVRGLAASARGREIEILELAARRRRSGPPPHARPVERLAWSPRGVLASADDEVVRLWDPATGVARAIYAPHARELAWSPDGATLYTSDGYTIAAWPIDLATGASPREVRARLDQLTTARIIDGRVATP